MITKNGVPARSTKYPELNRMRVDTSIFIPNVTPKRIWHVVEWLEKGTEKKFKTRSVDGGVRVYRVK
jgi:hypothetical protein